MPNTEALLEPFAAQEFYVDGFDGYEVSKDNIMSCYGYRQTRAGRQIMVRLVMPVSCLADAIGRANSAIQKTPMLALVERIGKAH